MFLGGLSPQIDHHFPLVFPGFPPKSAGFPRFFPSKGVSTRRPSGWQRPWRRCRWCRSAARCWPSKLPKTASHCLGRRFGLGKSVEQWGKNELTYYGTWVGSKVFFFCVLVVFNGPVNGFDPFFCRFHSFKQVVFRGGIHPPDGSCQFLKATGVFAVLCWLAKVLTFSGLEKKPF